MKDKIDTLIGDLKARGEKYDNISKFFGETGEELAAFFVIIWFIFTYDVELFKWWHVITGIPLAFLVAGNVSQFLHNFYGKTYKRWLTSVGYTLSFGVMAGYSTWALYHDVFCLMGYLSAVPVIMLLVALLFIQLSLNISKEIIGRLNDFERKLL